MSEQEDMPTEPGSFNSDDWIDYARRWRTRADELRSALSAARKETDAIRELMNVYNLGGWTDAIGPMKRALAAETALKNCAAYKFDQDLTAAQERAESLARELAGVKAVMAELCDSNLLANAELAKAAGRDYVTVCLPMRWIDAARQREGE